jgi:hypothetical protein
MTRFTDWCCDGFAPAAFVAWWDAMVTPGRNAVLVNAKTHKRDMPVRSPSHVEPTFRFLKSGRRKIEIAECIRLVVVA